MKELKGACIIGQSGGPTSVINASAYGAIKTALENECITNVYGACNGIKGVLDDHLIDMGKEDPDELAYMKYTPSSALGSCRYKLKDPDVDDTTSVFLKSSRNTMSVISSITAVTIQWTPATRSPNSCSRTAMNAV